MIENIAQECSIFDFEITRRMVRMVANGNFL